MGDEKNYTHKNLRMDADTAEWVIFAAAAGGQNQSAYILDAIRRDRDNSPSEVLQAFDAFKKARR